MAYRTSIPRIRRAIPKQGGAHVHLLRTTEQDVRHTLIEDARTLRNAHTERMAGYAIITWDKDAYAIGAVRTHVSPIPFDTVPDYIRNKAQNLVNNPN